MSNKQENIVDIKKLIPFSKTCQVVRDIVDILFDDDGNYTPEYYDYIFWVNISQAYAGLGAEMTADEFLEKLYNGWKDELVGAINQDQLYAIEDAVDKHIELRTNQNPFAPVAKALTKFLENASKEIDPERIDKLTKLVEGAKELNADELVKAVINNQK